MIAISTDHKTYIDDALAVAVRYAGDADSHFYIISRGSIFAYRTRQDEGKLTFHVFTWREALDLQAAGIWFGIMQASVPGVVAGWGHARLIGGDEERQIIDVYDNMPEDYRLRALNGRRSIMVNRNGATVLCPMDCLTADEIASRLPKPRMIA